MKKVVTIIITLLSASLIMNGSAYSSDRDRSFVNRENQSSKQTPISIAQSNDFIALAQQADKETGLALEQWERYYQTVDKMANDKAQRKSRANFDYLIAFAQNISQHHRNAARIASQMSSIAPNGNYEQKFVAALIENNTQAANSFSGFAQHYSRVKTMPSNSDGQIQGVWEGLAKAKQHLSIGKSNFQTIKQFVVYAGYRYYPYLGGDPQAAAEVANLIQGQAASLRQSGAGLACVGAANCTLVPSR